MKCIKFPLLNDKKIIITVNSKFDVYIPPSIKRTVVKDSIHSQRKQ